MVLPKTVNKYTDHHDGFMESSHGPVERYKYLARDKRYIHFTRWHGDFRDACGDGGVPISLGQYNTNQGPNFAIARARLTFGTSGTPSLGNVYSTGNFVASPNFASVPVGASVAWQLESQYPLPTYPSIQDVTQLPGRQPPSEVRLLPSVALRPTH
jgi:hypothetical protein